MTRMYICVHCRKLHANQSSSVAIQFYAIDTRRKYSFFPKFVISTEMYEGETFFSSFILMHSYFMHTELQHSAVR